MLTMSLCNLAWNESSAASGLSEPALHGTLGTDEGATRRLAARLARHLDENRRIWVSACSSTSLSSSGALGPIADGAKAIRQAQRIWVN